MGKVIGVVQNVDKIWLSMRETMTYLGCSRDYVYKLIDNGKIRAARDGKMTFVVKDSLDRYLRSLTVTI